MIGTAISQKPEPDFFRMGNSGLSKPSMRALAESEIS